MFNELDVVYTVTVTMMDGWGEPWIELYHKQENAEKRLNNLVEKYELEKDGDWDAYYTKPADFNHRIAHVEIDVTDFED
jgi:2-methylcitrate dehydratase PrpD